MYFLVFHGEERFHHKPVPPETDDAHEAHGDEPHHPHESPWVVTLPLVLLAIPSVVAGYLIGPMLFGDFFKGAIAVDAEHHPAMEDLARAFHGVLAMAAHAVTSPITWLALAGVACAWLFYLRMPAVPAAIQRRFGFVYRVLDNKYYMDWFNEHVIAPAARGIGVGLWKGGDVALIDGAINGSAGGVRAMAGVVRLVQTGFLYWYALVMILGVVALMTWQLWPYLSQLLRF